MRPRSPKPATSSSPLPSLVTLLAGVAAVEGCAPVTCGNERVDELAAHGPRSTDALRRGELRDGLREVAVAVGLLPHGATRIDTVTPGGAPPPITVTPVPEPAPQPPGGIRAAAPAPIEPPSEGGMREVSPTPPVEPAARPDSQR
ncbi:MAG: hypothetical protein R3A48_09580 [Polyangiales bacterium]